MLDHGNHRADRFRSAPPCGGRHALSSEKPREIAVSIRAPVRGATFTASRDEKHSTVSIRAPVRGATRRKSRQHGGVPVSIRAPVRGATKKADVLKTETLFRSAPPCGGRLPFAACITDWITRFDPRPRAGGDSTPTSWSSRAKCFDPRPRAGGDRLAAEDQKIGTAFRSAPPCGGRPPSKSAGFLSVTFRSAPPCGGRLDVQPFGPSPQQHVSIRAPVRGATGGSPWAQSGKPGFDPRPRAGGDETRMQDAVA